jgi:hypothetical protein
VNADPKWLTDAIEAARLSMTDVPDDPIDSCITAEDAVRAALPVIREGLAKEIEAASIANEVIIRDAQVYGHVAAIVRGVDR